MTDPLPFSRLELIEFQPWEFEKFRRLPIITDDDIRRCDVNVLVREIQEKP